MGDITVYSGPMRCGKTQQIISEYKRQLVAGKKIQMFKPAVDTRSPKDSLSIRDGSSIAIPTTSIDRIEDLKNYDVDVFCIDEFQFLQGDVQVINELADKGKKFYIAGLNLTAEKKPFGKMPELFSISDDIHMLNSICERCKKDNATLSYFKGGKDKDIVIGDYEYIPVCRQCYQELLKEDQEKKNM